LSLFKLRRGENLAFTPVLSLRTMSPFCVTLPSTCAFIFRPFQCTAFAAVSNAVAVGRSKITDYKHVVKRTQQTRAFVDCEWQRVLWSRDALTENGDQVRQFQAAPNGGFPTFCDSWKFQLGSRNARKPPALRAKQPACISAEALPQ